MDFLRVGLPQVVTAFGVEPFRRSLSWTGLLLGLWCLLATAEWASRFALFRDDGLLSWRVLALRPQWVHRSRLAGIVHRPRGVALVLGLRLACAALLLLAPQGWTRVGLLAALVATGWLMKLRNWLGEDGADHMGQVVAGQLTISYFLAGAAKLASFEWRSGRALVGVMGTGAYGHPFAARVATAGPWVPIVFCWCVIAIETVFPAFLFAPREVLLGVLAAFALFHGATAFFMGLNTFVWAFIAAYPSLLVVHALLQQLMGRG
jgi:hypothetical protein